MKGRNIGDVSKSSKPPQPPLASWGVLVHFPLVSPRTPQTYPCFACIGFLKIQLRVPALQHPKRVEMSGIPPLVFLLRGAKLPKFNMLKTQHANFPTCLYTHRYAMYTPCHLLHGSRHRGLLGLTSKPVKTARMALLTRPIPTLYRETCPTRGRGGS